MLGQFTLASFAQGQADVTASSIYGKVVDAGTGAPIHNATVLIWDLTTFDPPLTCHTDLEGLYEATVVRGHKYWIFAYRGDAAAMEFDYVPSGPAQAAAEQESVNASFRLVPGASVIIAGDIFSIEGRSPYRVRFHVIDPATGQPPPKYDVDYLSAYGDHIYVYFLFGWNRTLQGPARNLIIAPADTPFHIRADAYFYSLERRQVSVVTFSMDNDTGSYVLPRGERYPMDIARYSLTRTLHAANSYIRRVSSMVEEAQNAGFYVFNERNSLSEALSKVLEADSHLAASDYLRCWETLREAYVKAQLVDLALGYMRRVAASDACRLPVFFAVYGVALAFFLFEDDRKKLVSSLLFYGAFLAALFWIYPGTRLIASQNMPLFLQSAAVSMVSVLAVVFGVPRVWREPMIEGRVTLRNMLSVIFSMAKRQVRRMRLRSSFTIASIIILVFAFTSLTSFGVVYGIVSDKLPVRPPAEGMMVKRLGVEGVRFIPLTLSDLEALRAHEGEWGLRSVSPKAENLPYSSPVATLLTPKGASMPVCGVIGISPASERAFTKVNEIVERGDYLEEEDEDGILISVKAASDFSIGVNDAVQFYVRGIPSPLGSLTVKGLFNDGQYDTLVDLDGEPFGPTQVVVVDGKAEVTSCASRTVVIMNWRTAMRLQRMADALMEGAPQFAVISRVAFRAATQRLDVEKLVTVYAFRLYVSSGDRVMVYRLGERYEAKGVAELAIPIVMVALNVGAVMLNAVYERKREMQALTVLGLNPVHIAAIFVAEAIVVGLVGGGIGYLFGLGFYRAMAWFGRSLVVREKLEWWWSVVGLALALLASVLSAVRPAMMAVRLYTPSMIKRVKLTRREREIRREKIFKVFQPVEISMPVRVRESEAPFFYAYFVGRVRDLEAGYRERTEEIEELPEMEGPRGERVKRIRFGYAMITARGRRGTRNELICARGPEESFYRVRLRCAPAAPGTPEDWVDRTIAFTRDILLDWVKDKKRIMGIG